MSPRDPRPPRRLMHAVLVLGMVQAIPHPALQSAAWAQPRPDNSPVPSLKSPVPWQVFQRTADDRGEIPIVFGDDVPAESILGVSLGAFLADGQGRVTPATAIYRDGKLVNVPTGGPYRVDVSYKRSGGEGNFSMGPVFVGDLWVLAGQSNMEGVGDLVDVTPPSPRVMALGMDGKWAQASEPLHWLVDSPDRVHSGDPADREQRSKDQHKNRTKGAGLGLPFGVVLAARTGAPIGLVACAHGGTSMQQWDPAKKGEGGDSLYGSMLRQVKLAGGKVRGVLWYQGESDANPKAAPEYGKTFASFIAAVREDLGDPGLPFYFVQIGRFILARDPKDWNTVQEAQRLVPDRVPNTAVVAAVDLELDDLIHVGTPGLKRLGTRLARIALREVYGLPGATTPTLDHVRKGPNNTLILKFKGVNRAPSGSTARTASVPADLGPNVTLQAPSASPAVVPPRDGLKPVRHIAGFSIRKDDGTDLPLIYDAAVAPSKDTVVLKLFGNVPEGARLWYGHGLDPYCNLTDALDMAVPVFGPIALDDIK